MTQKTGGGGLQARLEASNELPQRTETKDSQVTEIAKNGRNKPGDKLRNEVGMEWEISVWTDCEILRKWAEWLGHRWEPSVKQKHE